MVEVNLDAIIKQARKFAEQAQESNVDRLDATVEVDGKKVEFRYELVVIDPESDVREAVITAKVGSKSRPKIVLALPVEWFLKQR